MRYVNGNVGDDFFVRDTRVNGLPLIRVKASDDAFILASHLNNMEFNYRELYEENKKLKKELRELKR